MLNPEDKAAVIAKIRKCLALAQDAAATPNEAATAARMAENMMRKYNLENADVIMHDMKNTDNLDRVWCRATARKNAPRPNKETQLWAQILASNTAKLFDCHASIGKTMLKQGMCSVVNFYGYKTDVEVCRWTYEYLLDCTRRLCRAFEAEAERMSGRSASSKRAAIDVFRFGVATAICNNLSAAIYAKEQQDKANSTSTALVVVKRNAVEEKYGKFEYTPAGEEQAEKARKAAFAFARGVQEGKKINISPNPLENKEKEPSK